jgi:hypothetical protein
MTNTFNHETIKNAIASKKDILLQDIYDSVQKKLRSLSPSEALSFRLMDGEQEVKTISPALTKEYAGSLIAFSRGKKFNSQDVDSAVTPIVTAVIEESLIRVFSSEQMSQVITEAVLEEFGKNNVSQNAMHSEIKNQQTMLKNELIAITHQHTAHSIAGSLIDISAQQIHDFLVSSVGKQLMLGVSQLMATTAGKVLVLQILKVTVAKVMASVALKTVLLSAIRKVGVGILIKTAIGKALIALLAVVGLAHVPAIWIILPVLAGFLAYEYNTFPDKLAEKIPKAAVAIINEKFLDISDVVAKSAAMHIFDEMMKRLTAVKLNP